MKLISEISEKLQKKKQKITVYDVLKIVFWRTNMQDNKKRERLIESEQRSTMRRERKNFVKRILGAFSKERKNLQSNFFKYGEKKFSLKMK